MKMIEKYTNMFECDQIEIVKQMLYDFDFKIQTHENNHMIIASKYIRKTCQIIIYMQSLYNDAIKIHIIDASTMQIFKTYNYDESIDEIELSIFD